MQALMLTELMTHVDPLLDRRLTPRVKLTCPMGGRIPSLNLSVTMVECSDGGFSTRSQRHLPIGSLYDFNFTTSDHKQIDVTARVVHSLRASSSTRPLFFTGFAKG